LRNAARGARILDAGASETGASAVSVAGTAITFERVEERLAALRESPQGRRMPPGEGPETDQTRRWLLRQLITEAIIAYEMRASGAGSVADLFAQVTASVRVHEDEVHAFYLHNPDRFRRPAARRIQHLLRADFITAARAATGDGSAAGTWEALRVQRGELVGELENALFAAQVGSFVGPIRTEHGWHVAQIESADPETVEPFGVVREAIEAELLVEARGRAFDEWLETRRRMLVLSDSPIDHPGLPRVGFVGHRH
jgi:[acyl-carrier-protein] S-malonyltransferase